ncbi:hypothetical protein ACLOJK_015292 [Asimina triloba]
MLMERDKYRALLERWERNGHNTTNADKLDLVLEQVAKSMMTQKAVRLEMLTRFESLQRVLTDIATYVIKIEERQASQDTEMTSLRERVQVLQRQPTETLTSLLEKKSAEIPTEVLDQIRRKAMTSQTVPRRWVKVIASKRAAYPESDNDTEPTEETPVQ